MVAIKAGEADRFLANLPGHVFLYLVFGTDSGLVSERARSIATRSVSDPKDPFQLVRLDGDDIAADPLKLADEAHTVGLFGGKRAIWIELGSKNIVPALDPILSTPPQDCVIVIEAGALKRDSALRRMVEASRSAAAVESNADDAAALDRLIEAEARTAGVALDPEARQLLKDRLGEDRLTTRSELAKLFLYARGKESIDLDDVRAAVADASALAVDDAIHAAFSGRFAEVSETLGKAFATGNDPGVMLGQALRHAVSLHRARLEADQGTPLEAAVDRAARAPFHVKKIMAAQARNWQTGRLERAIEVLSEAIRRTRREPGLSRPLAVRALWSVALAAHRKGG